MINPLILDEQIGGDHYKTMRIQPVVFCQVNRLGFCEASAIKYICRHGKKGGRQDLAKAIHFLKILQDIEYPEVQPL